MLRRRRLIAVVLTAVAVALGVRAAAPPAPATVDLLVADRELAAGARVAPEDLRSMPVPPDVVPQGVVADPVGKILAGPLGAGEPVTVSRVVGKDLVTATPDSVPLPLRVSDAGMVELLEVGARVDLFATDPQAAETTLLADDVVVLALPPAEQTATAGADGAITGRLVVFGIPVIDVQQVTSQAVTAYVTFAWATR